MLLSDTWVAANQARCWWQQLPASSSAAAAAAVASASWCPSLQPVPGQPSAVRAPAHASPCRSCAAAAAAAAEVAQ
jgi:hypothetical protein